MTTSPSPTPRDRKSTLFCPDCGHASPVDGDWEVRTVAGRRRTRCPECRRVVDRRVAERRPARAAARGAPVRWYVDALDRCRSAWTSLVADGLSH